MQGSRKMYFVGGGDNLTIFMHDSLILAIDSIPYQGDEIHICYVLRSLSAVKLKVKGQLKIFFEVNSQVIISL